uniref:Uncharacterized protein n=1 Tax=Arundo donax TaxID=35708 RepID=A0A0A9FNW3_ARUDO
MIISFLCVPMISLNLSPAFFLAWCKTNHDFLCYVIQRSHSIYLLPFSLHGARQIMTFFVM